MSSIHQKLRHVVVEGVANLRNLGGYHTNDGTRCTKWGVVYRSDQPSCVPKDVAQKVLVDQLHIHHVYDLRDKTEVSMKGYDFPQIQRISLPIDVSDTKQFLKEGENLKEAATARSFMREIYRQFVRAYAPTVGIIIKGIIDSNVSSDNAVLIHCTAGKDRTGWSCYMLLTLLDVTEVEKRNDYLLTNTHYHMTREAYNDAEARDMSEEAMKFIWSAFDDYLDAALDEVKKMGGLDGYIKLHMGLTDEDITKLRDLMLE